MNKIPMVDLKSQYLKIKDQIDQKIQDVINSSQFIKGTEVEAFEKNFGKYLNNKHVIACANGTDALQLALMALNLEKGDEVISPAFNYIACAETICLLGLKPVYVDVDADSFNIDISSVESAITSKTKAIIAVHLYGQSCDLDPLIEIAEKHKLYLIEDNAQSIGSVYKSKSRSDKIGNFGHVATTSFFPSKNLACYGDGGAVYTNDKELAERLRKLGSHGQVKRYHHDYIGINSRLDTIQAAVLNVKLNFLDSYILHRQNTADTYDTLLSMNPNIICPKRMAYSSHVFHQYTIRVLNNRRDELQNYLHEKGVSSSVHYPMPVYKQNAYKHTVNDSFYLSNSEMLSNEVLSLPMDTEIRKDQITYICNHINSFFNI